jgi:hypothetical protein
MAHKKMFSLGCARRKRADSHGTGNKSTQRTGQFIGVDGHQDEDGDGLVGGQPPRNHAQ